MNVVALVGPSGTGKSHRALSVARQCGADAIIDDGILIRDGKIVAGRSAKHEKSRIMAVKRAIFVLPGHADEMRAALDEDTPACVLILATSENMIRRIAKTLGLPQAERIIRIEDIASRSEMAEAEFYRKKEGKHIIPVPTIELKPHFSGYLIDPIQSFFKKARSRRRQLGEKSIVRPIFSYYGKLVIDDSAIRGIVEKLMGKKSFVNEISRVEVRHVLEDDGEDKGIQISCEVVLRYGKHIPTLIRQTQERIKEAIEYMTGMVVHEVNIMVRTLYVTA